MIVTMIDRLLDHIPLKPDAADRTKEAAAGYGQHNPQHPIVNGAGDSYMDSMGNPWTGAYVTASGHLMADFLYNATRSEERRVGKEGRSRGSPYHLRTKRLTLGRVS